MGHVGWRARNPEDLEKAVANLEAAGAGEGWSEDAVGRGAAFRYRGPGGHQHEIFWEIEEYEAPDPVTTDGVADMGHSWAAWFIDPSRNVLAVVQPKG